MSLDSWVVIVISVFALLGFWRGAARQIASVVALVCASFASRPLSSAIGPWWAQQQPSLSLPMASLLAFALTFALTASLAYALVLLSFRPVAPKHNEPPPPRLSPLLNKTLGLAFGSLKGALLLWLLLSLAALLGEKLEWLPFRLPWSFENSRAYALAKQHNAFNQEQWTKLLLLEKMAQLPPYAAQLLPTGNPNQPPNPLAQKLKKLLENPELSKAFETKKFKTLLKNKELDTLLSDESFLKALDDFQNFSKMLAPSPPPASSEE